MSEIAHSINCAPNAKPKGPWKGHRWHKTTLRQRFEEKFLVTPGCWIWIAGCTESGYSAFKVNGIQTRGHRFSYELYIGPIPEGLIVMHRCDNPKCVNPDHLSVGTNADNVADRDSKGRTKAPRGEAHGQAKFSDAVIRAIRSDTRKGSLIAKEYGTTRGYVYAIKARRKRAHVD